MIRARNESKAKIGSSALRQAKSGTGRSVEACVVPGCLELPLLRNTRYFAFVDPSGGSSDSMTLAIRIGEETISG
jgi:hypothetical protein